MCSLKKHFLCFDLHHGAASEHMNSIPVRGSQAMGGTQEYIPCVLQLLMDIQSVGPKTRAGVKQNPT